VRWLAGCIIVAAVLVLSGCASRTEKRAGATSEPVSQSVSGPGAGRLVDDSGQIGEWAFRFDEELEAEDPREPFGYLQEPIAAASVDDGPWLVASPLEGWDLRIVWGALPCQQQPRVVVAGAGGLLTAITIYRGPRVPADCEAMEARYAVDLRTAAVPAPDIDIVVAD
jgi:hypothetical protein